MYTRFVPILTLLLLLLPIQVWSQPTCRHPVRLGIGEPWPPFVMLKKPNLSGTELIISKSQGIDKRQGTEVSDPQQQDFTGIDVEIVKLVLADSGTCVEIVRIRTSARAITELEKGHIDLLASASLNTERQQVGYYSIPYRRETMRIYWHNKQPIHLNSLVSLFKVGMIGAVNLGAYYGIEFKLLMEHAEFSKQIVSVASLEQRMKLLALNRVDFVIDDALSGAYYIKKHQFNQLAMHPYIVHDNATHLLFSRKTIKPELVDKVNQAIMENELKIKQLIESYLAAP